MGTRIPRQASGSRTEVKLPGWNFNVGTAHDVRVVDDDRSGLGSGLLKAIHADGRSTILAPGLPDNAPSSSDDKPPTGILRRVVVRPTMTGAIPCQKALRDRWRYLVLLVGVVSAALSFRRFSRTCAPVEPP